MTATFAMPGDNVKVSATFKKSAYAVIAKTPANGSLSLDKSTAQIGDAVTLTATANGGYELDALTVTRNDNGETVSVDGTSFTMPASPVTASATFKKKTYNVVVQEDANGTVTASATTVQAGNTLTLMVESNEGYRLSTPLYIFSKNPPDSTESNISSELTATANEYGVLCFTVPDNFDADVTTITVAPRFTSTDTSFNITKMSSNDTPSGCDWNPGRSSASYGDTVRVAVTNGGGYVFEKLNVKNLTTNRSVPVPPNADFFVMPDAPVEVGATFVFSYERDITVEKIGEGAVVVKRIAGENETEVTKAAYCATIKLEITPAEGYELELRERTSLLVVDDSNLIVNFLPDETPPDATNKTVRMFIMPRDEVIVMVSFKKIQTIGGSDAVTVTYGETANMNASAQGNAALTYRVEEGKGDDVVSVDASGNITPLKAGSAVVTVTAEPTSSDGINYTGATKDVVVIVTPKPLTVTAAEPDSKTRGEDDPELTYTVDGILEADTDKVLTGALARDEGENVGTYAIMQGTLDTGGEAGGNYTISAYTGAYLTITTKAVTPDITLTLPAGGYVYDGTAKTPAVTVKDGDAVIPESEYALSYASNTNAGTATVTVTDKDGGVLSCNGEK